MNFAFSEEQEEFRQTLRRFFAERSPVSEVFRWMETPEGFDPSLWKQMAAELGLPGVHLPEAHGGQGFGFLELGLVVEEMGRALVCAPFFSSVCLAANAVCNAGRPEQQARWLPELASAYLDRTDVRPGMILPGDEVVAAFAAIGWHWGGEWSEPDHMHFSRDGG